MLLRAWGLSGTGARGRRSARFCWPKCTARRVQQPGPARPGVVGLSRLTSGYLSVELRVQGAAELLSGRPGFRSVGQVGVVD